MCFIAILFVKLYDVKKLDPVLMTLYYATNILHLNIQENLK